MSLLNLSLIKCSKKVQKCYESHVTLGGFNNGMYEEADFSYSINSYGEISDWDNIIMGIEFGIKVEARKKGDLIYQVKEDDNTGWFFIGTEDGVIERINRIAVESSSNVAEDDNEVEEFDERFE